jgi:dihydropteroate synthase
MRPRYTWRLRSRSLELGERTVIMGVINVTPDSFSDGGLYFDRDRATEHALSLLDEGADILDIGGESTRPGAMVADHASVSAEEESRRVLPVIEAVLRARPGAILSIDTYKAEVARRAVRAGAEIVNDVSAGRWDALMLPTLADLNCGVVLMHMRGRPEEWRTLPRVDDITSLVSCELSLFAAMALQARVERDRVVLDPGFGFGKNFGENFPLLARFRELLSLGYPLLAGTSRKGFIGRALGNGAKGKDEQRHPRERVYGSVAAMTAAILAGAHVVRVHEVAAARDASRIADAVVAAEECKIKN